MSLRIRSAFLSSLGVCVAFACIAGGATAAMAQDEADETLDAPAAPQSDEETARVEAERILRLVLPQQKERARELIRQYPNTETAQLLRRVLDEYAQYDEFKAAERAEADARTMFVREFWRSRTEHVVPVYQPPVARIVNDADEPVTFQLRLRQTVWMGPYLLRGGQEQILYEPAQIRRVVGGAVQVQPVVPGSRYEFREGAPGMFDLVILPETVFADAIPYLSPSAESNVAPPAPAPLP